MVKCMGVEKYREATMLVGGLRSKAYFSLFCHTFVTCIISPWTQLQSVLSQIPTEAINYNLLGL